MGAEVNERVRERNELNCIEKKYQIQFLKLAKRMTKAEMKKQDGKGRSERERG